MAFNSGHVLAGTDALRSIQGRSRLLRGIKTYDNVQSETGSQPNTTYIFSSVLGLFASDQVVSLLCEIDVLIQRLLVDILVFSQFVDHLCQHGHELLDRVAFVPTGSRGKT